MHVLAYRGSLSHYTKLRGECVCLVAEATNEATDGVCVLVVSGVNIKVKGSSEKMTDVRSEVMHCLRVSGNIFSNIQISKLL